MPDPDHREQRRQLRFGFELRALPDVAPWGGPGAQRLHWFGLTDGWYWIELPGIHLLRYAAEEGGDAPRKDEYADYYVVRLWEDLLAVHQAAVEPVPDDLVPFLRRPPDEWPEALDLSGSPAEGDPDVQAALDWLWSHDVDQGLLTNAPSLRLWTDQEGARLTVTWRHGTAPGVRFDAPQNGEAVLEPAEFTAALADLDRRLISAMAERVELLVQNGPPPGVTLDLDHLQAEHEDRSQWLGRRLSTPTHTDWESVRRGAQHLMALSPERERRSP